MSKIELLSKDTIDQIAAGEVVERPASVVKELVENAIDADASAVTVEIREGGRKLIRITDNGTGISPDQIEMAFLRHATSKIRSVDDLLQIASLGFRGEALSSIASVSRVECITKTADTLAGIRYVNEGGTMLDMEEVGAPDGTTFLVRDLFYNTPARKKFLLTASAEGSRVRTLMERMALSHPGVAFTYIQDGRTVLFTSGNGNIPDIVYQIYGKEIAQGLIPFRSEQKGIRITGYFGTARIARGNRAGEIFFVNSRMIQSDILAKAVEEGYHGFLMQHRYPFVLLFLDIDGTMVDVNVHPAKREVRFSDNDAVFRSLCLAIQQTLLAGEHIPETTVSEKDQKEEMPAPSEPVPEPFEEIRRNREYGLQKPVSPVKEPDAMYTVQSAGQKAFKTQNPPAEQMRIFQEQAEPEIPEEADVSVTEERKPVRVLSSEARPYYRLIGQVFDTYWLMEYQEKLYIIDQHAAHEKVLYEQLMKAYREKTVMSQMIFPAVVVEPGPAEAEMIRNRMQSFADLGFELEEFGGDSFKISAVPANLYRIDPHDLFTDILDELRTVGNPAPESVAERLASMACKAAVKGNTALSRSEAEKLFDELLKLENPYHCPHGRPTIIAMTREELDKDFKRIV
ncbi:MAG: DNA mismatch repair endonuclease MutL [Eubacterium sp.]|nr:DNA mismatch repair endonuclease MutL [Eubacterium sp.]